MLVRKREECPCHLCRLFLLDPVPSAFNENRRLSGGAGGREDLLDVLLPTCEKRISLSLFECFSYVCPERVLVKCSLLAKMTSQKICVLRTRHGQDHVLCAGNEEGGLCYWRSGELRRRVVVDIHHPVLSDEQILRHAQHRQTAH